jgi:hypothetical protein
VFIKVEETHTLNTTEKDILLVKNILHIKEYDIVMDDINEEKEGRRNKETD